MSTEDSTHIRLSVCIGTYNREHHIRATLDSVIAQLNDSCEIVISDNASTDNTGSVVREYTRRCSRLRYFRNDTNLGLDRNFDRAVERARGEYCWLMSDDDVVKPGAILRVLNALQHATSVVIVNGEYRDVTMSQVVQRRALHYKSDRLYGPTELDRLFTDMAHFVGYIGSAVVRRDLWMARNRSRFFGYGFIQIGVVFQDRLPRGALFIADPLVSVRLGNVHTFSASVSDILFHKWPQVLALLPISQAARKRAFGSDPAREYSWLLKLRALGWYSAEEYTRWIRPQLQSLRQRLVPALIARAPFVLVNRLLALCCFFFMRSTEKRYLYECRVAREIPHQDLFID